MTHLLPAVMAGLLGSWAAAATWLAREARAVLRHVPPAVGELLLHASTRDELLRIIAGIAAYANLAPEERRQKAIQFVAQWLENHGIHLSDSQLSLLVELLYAWLKERQPERIAPAPLSLTGGRP
jgi:hypothetical protein